MQAIVCNGYGGPEVMGLKDVPTPQPGPGQVRIKVLATSVNRADTVQRKGNYPPPPGASEILGLEVAGTVDAVGSDVDGWQVGERVMSLVEGGGYAQFALAHAGHLMAIPEGLSFEAAACVAEVYITAYLNLFMLAGLQDGETVLLHGGGGGVNTAGIQICRALRPDCKIVVTASTGKVARVQALGADHVIDYQNQAFAEAVNEITKGRGVNVILDHIGAAYLTPNLEALAIGGRLVIIGLMGGAEAQIHLGRLMVKRQQVMGSVLRARAADEKSAITRAFETAVLPRIADGSLLPLIHKTFPLADAADAHREMEASRHFGKIVLTP